MGWDAPWHWIVLAVIVIALFGYKKLPEASRALGRSLRIFKTEIKGMTEDDRVRDDVAKAPPAVAAPVTPTAPAVPPTPVTPVVPVQQPTSVTPVVPVPQPAPVTTPGTSADGDRPDATR